MKPRYSVQSSLQINKRVAVELENRTRSAVKFSVKVRLYSISQICLKIWVIVDFSEKLCVVGLNFSFYAFKFVFSYVCSNFFYLIADVCRGFYWRYFSNFYKKGACNGLYLPGKLLFGKPSRAREFQKITVKHNLK